MHWFFSLSSFSFYIAEDWTPGLRQMLYRWVMFLAPGCTDLILDTEPSRVLPSQNKHKGQKRLTKSLWLRCFHMALSLVLGVEWWLLSPEMHYSLPVQILAQWQTSLILFQSVKLHCPEHLKLYKHPSWAKINWEWSSIGLMLSLLRRSWQSKSHQFQDTQFHFCQRWQSKMTIVIWTLRVNGIEPETYTVGNVSIFSRDKWHTPLCGSVVTPTSTLRHGKHPGSQGTKGTAGCWVKIQLLQK